MGERTAGSVPVLISTYLEPEHVERIAASDPRVEVLYAPDLLPPPRYPCDHSSPGIELTAAGRSRWQALRARAEVAFDFDWQDPAGMPTNCPRLRWVQATSAGIGARMRNTGLHDADLAVTTAAGIHAVPLAEYALAGALYFVKGFPHLRRRQTARHWERHTTYQLAGRTVTVVGLGGIGRQVARSFAALGTRVIGIGRPGRSYDVPGCDTVVSTAELSAVLPETDVLVLACPLTPETEGLVGARELALLPDHAVLVNVARGQVVDEPALVRALVGGSLAGACLDVFHTEPLPADSPLWGLDNVLVSPHSSSTVASENAALTDLFVDNLRRWLDGAPLRNTYRRDLGY